jgi:hypothetical protein
MANATDVMAVTVHGQNPQYLVEKILRNKIYGSTYWKEACFGLTAETLVDRAVALTYVGGTYGGQRKPTKFMCLLLKMLQIQPEKAIILEFIKVRARCALAGSPLPSHATPSPAERDQQIRASARSSVHAHGGATF